MSLHDTPERHDADPPSAWTVTKDSDRCWHLDSSLGYMLDSFTTRKAAEQAKVNGPLIDLYEKEGRWYAGEQIPGWRPYADIVAERERRAARSS